MAAVASVTPSSNAYINALLSNYKWASGSLTYSFPSSYTYYESGYGSNEPLRNFEGLNGTQQGAVRAAFANFAAVANVTFTELTGASAANATLRLAMSDAPNTAWGYMPHTAAEGGDSWYNNASGVYDNPLRGNYAYTTFLHEIGHTLGLEHPHENGMPIDRDSMEYTVMTYRPYVGAPLTGYTNESWGYAQTLMTYDIAAIQLLYGANFSSNSGNTTYSWSPTTGQAFIDGVAQATPGGNRIFQTVWDGGGTDTYDFSNYATALNVDLGPGQWTTTSSAQLARLHYNGGQIADGNIANALQYNGDARSLVENAVGGNGNDTIAGNNTANSLWGGIGDDFILGAEGGDTIYGGAGNDRIDGGTDIDTAVWQGDFSEYNFSRDRTGAIIAQDMTSGRDGIDSVFGVERFVFSDRTLGAEELFSTTLTTLALRSFGADPSAGGWTSDDRYPRQVADVNGDGRADIVGFGGAGIFVSLADTNSSFGAALLAYRSFGTDLAAGGWTSNDSYPRQMADVNGDGRADIIGFGGAGVFVAMGNTSGSFAGVVLASRSFGADAGAGGWASDDRHPRQMADINGDGRADIIGFGGAGVFVALGNANGTFASAVLASRSFGADATAGGWTSNDRYPRQMADVNGDGRADIVGFGGAGVFVALANANGSFGDAVLASESFGADATAGGWSSDDRYPRRLADVNGDGRADIVGFGGAGAYVAVANADGSFGSASLELLDFGTNDGWTSNDSTPRFLADLDGDDRAEIVGFGELGVFISGADFIV